VLGPGQTFLTRVKSGQIFVARRLDQVSYLWFGFGKFPLKFQNFAICSPLDQKISSGRVKKHPGQSGVELLFTAGQKNARVGLQKKSV